MHVDDHRAPAIGSPAHALRLNSHPEGVVPGTWRTVHATGCTWRGWWCPLQASWHHYRERRA